MSAPTGWKKQGDGWPHKRKPIIGVAGPQKGSWPAWLCIRFLIWLGGGKAIHITPGNPQPLYELDGLILSGGADVHPGRYKEKVIQTIRSENVKRWTWRLIFSVVVWIFRKLFSLKHSVGATESKLRDALEFALLEESLKKCLPVLGICRGAQLINVFFGGSLYQDTKPFYVEKPELHTILPLQKIMLDPNTLLYGIFRKEALHVNSLHYQSVHQIGRGLKIAAQDSNGIVEAVEHTNFPFVIGVQWHPEFLFFIDHQRLLFKKLVEQARFCIDNRPAFQ